MPLLAYAGPCLYPCLCDGMVEILVSVEFTTLDDEVPEARKALKPTSDSRLQDFLGTLQSFEAYLRFKPP